MSFDILFHPEPTPADLRACDRLVPALLDEFSDLMAALDRGEAIT